MKKLAVLGLSLFFGLAAAQVEGGVLQVATVSEPTSLDPITTNNVPSSIIFMQIHDSLVTYDEELNLKEIGAVLGVSESRACQIHGQALMRLRSRMRDWRS